MRDVYSAGRAVERGAWDDDGSADADAPQAAAPDLTLGTPPDVPNEFGVAVGGPYDGPSAVPDAVSSERPVNRRSALKVLGALPVAAGVLGAQPPTGTAPQQPRQPHTTPNQPASGAPQPPSNQAKAKFFTTREARTAAVLADDIIPRDERSGSATDAKVVEFIDFQMSVPETSTETRTAMHGGLRWLDVETRRRFGVAYDRATEAQRHAILDDISVAPAQARPAMRAGAAFFSQFRSLVGAGFFSSALGYRDLQYLGNVFNPNWNGCPQPALDKLGVSYAVMQTRVPPQQT